MAKQREGGKVVDMYRGSSSLGCGTVQVRRVWFILSRLASMRARPGTIAHVLGSAVSTAPGDAVCSSHSQQWGSEPQVTFCGCAVAVPAAAAERQSWILPRWKTPGLTDQRTCQLLGRLRQERWASRRKGCRRHSPLLPGQACSAQRWGQEFLQTRAWHQACWAQ